MHSPSCRRHERTIAHAKQTQAIELARIACLDQPANPRGLELACLFGDAHPPSPKGVGGVGMPADAAVMALQPVIGRDGECGCDVACDWSIADAGTRLRQCDAASTAVRRTLLW